MIDRLSRFLYDTAGDFITSLPCRVWTPNDETVGGQRIAASGVPASYVVRRDSTLTLTLRLIEDEWDDFLAMMIFAQSAAAFLWYPDATLASAFSVYLQSPAAGEKITPTRDGQYPRVFEVTITLRSTDGSPLWTPYFTT